MHARLGWLAWLMLVAACIVLPWHALYGQGGPFVRQVANSAPWKSVDECLVLLGAIYLGLRWRRGGFYLGILALELFARRHGIDVTLILLFVYFAGMHALGRLCFPSYGDEPLLPAILRRLLAGMTMWAAVIWLASAVGVGSLMAIRWAAAGLLGTALAVDALRHPPALRLPARPTTRLGALLVALAITVIAMLAAKAAAALDSDAFWYGVNADRVLMGEGGLFQPQGLVAHVHYYPKLAESLQIPFLGMGSASLVAGFNLACWTLLVATARELLREAGVVSPRLAWSGALLAGCVPAVLASAATAKGEVFAAWLCMMGLLAGMRLARVREREAATWLATGLVAVLLAPLGRVTVLPYAAAIACFIGWQTFRHRARPTVRESAPLTIVGLAVFSLVCWRTWRMTGVALATPDVVVDLQTLVGWQLRDDVGRYVPQFQTPFPSGLLESLFGPADYIHQALFWMGNAWIPLWVAAIALRGSRWMLRDAMPFWLALGLCMYVLLYAYRYGPDGPDGNYFIVPIMLLHLATWAGCTGNVGADAMPRPLLAGAGVMLAWCLFLVLTTANWLPGLTRLDANFERTPFSELDRMAAARFRTSGMNPLADTLAAWPASTRMVGDMPEGDGGFFPVRYESLLSISWARPPLVAGPAAVRAFLLSHGITLVALRPAPSAPVSRWTLAAITRLEAEGLARRVSVPGAGASLWEMTPTRTSTTDVKMAGPPRH